MPQPGQDLRRYESTVLEGIFETSNPVKLSDLKYHFADTLKVAEDQMYGEVVERGWFRRSSQSQRAGWQALGFVLIGGGVASLFYLGAATRDIDRTAGLHISIPSGVILGAGLVIAGLIFRILGKRMAAKTAEGSAVLAQSLGFKQYLVTAEANQIKFEEAQSIFSRYLPYAIVFGVADRWASTFQQVAEAAAAAGTQIMMSTWYLYSGAAFPNFGGIADGWARSPRAPAAPSRPRRRRAPRAVPASPAVASPAAASEGRAPAPGEKIDVNEPPISDPEPRFSDVSLSGAGALT